MGDFGAAAPHPTDKQTVLISYSIAAEMSVFEACRWRRPSRAIDLFAEHRVNINGLSCKDLVSPPDAMGYLRGMEAVEKSTYSFDLRIETRRVVSFFIRRCSRNQPPVTYYILSFLLLIINGEPSMLEIDVTKDVLASFGFRSTPRLRTGVPERTPPCVMVDAH